MFVFTLNNGETGVTVTSNGSDATFALIFTVPEDALNEPAPGNLAIRLSSV